MNIQGRYRIDQLHKLESGTELVLVSGDGLRMMTIRFPKKIAAGGSVEVVFFGGVSADADEKSRPFEDRGEK